MPGGAMFSILPTRAYAFSYTAQIAPVWTVSRLVGLQVANIEENVTLPES